MDDDFEQVVENIRTWAKNKIEDEKGIDEVLTRAESILLSHQRTVPFWEIGQISSNKELVCTIVDVLNILAASDKEWQNVRQANYVIYLCSNLMIHEPIFRLSEKNLSVQKSRGATRSEDYAYSLLMYATEAEKQELSTEALENYLQSVEIYKSLGADYDNRCLEINVSIFAIYEKHAKYDDAEMILLNIMQIVERINGKYSVEYLMLMEKLSDLYYKANRIEDAAAQFKRYLDLEKKVNGENTEKYSTGLDCLARLYKESGSLDDAIVLLEKALIIEKKISGEDSIRYTTALNNLAIVFADKHDLVKASEFLTRSLHIEKSMTGEYTTNYLTGLVNLAHIRENMELFDQAEEMYHKALEVIQILGEQDSADHASILGDIADLYKKQDRLDDSEKYYVLYIQMIERVQGGSTLQYLDGLRDLSFVYHKLGRLNDGVEIAQKNLSLTLDFSGKETLRYAIGLHHLGLYYSEIGRYGEAESLLLESLQIKKKTIGVGSRSYAVGLIDIAALYNRLGRFSDAEDKYIECLELLERIGYESTIEFTTTLMSLASTYKDMGMLDKAIFLLVQSHNIEINLSIDHSENYADRLNLAGILYYESGVLDEAEKLFRRCLEECENSQTKGKKTYAAAMSNLANLLAESNRFKEAMELFQKCLEIEKVYEGENPHNLATLYSNFARQFFEAEDFESALQHATEAANYWEKCYRSVVRTASRESIVEMNKKSSHFYYLLLSLLIYKENYKHAPRALKLVIRRQSGEIYAMRMRDELIEHFATEEEKEELIRIEKNVLHNSRSPFESDYSASSLNADIEVLNNDRFLIETEVLSRASKAASQGKETENGFYLPEEFIVDYCWYLDFFSEFTGYCAVVYKPGHEEDGEIIFLDQAEKIDNMVKKLRNLIMTNNDHSISLENNQNNETIGEILQTLRAQLYEPIARIHDFSKASRISVCADGELTKLPFELVIPDMKLRYLTSATDGEWISLSHAENEDDIVAGAPDVGEAQTEWHKNDGIKKAGFPMATLIFTPQECSRIKTKLEKRNKGSLSYLVGTEFNKANVMKTRKPRIWHISTHGFFYENEERIDVLSHMQLHPFERHLMQVQDPYSRCGLAMFRANRAMEGPEEAKEVLVTGRDILELDLTGTDLVVLSACNTGLGDVHNGDGVWGLQRAFLLAGVKTIIMSLWQVDDLATSILMDKMYDGILSGKRIDESLQEAKRYVRESTRATFQKSGWTVNCGNPDDKPYEVPFYWAGLICLGSGGVVN